MHLREQGAIIIMRPAGPKSTRREKDRQRFTLELDDEGRSRKVVSCQLNPPLASLFSSRGCFIHRSLLLSFSVSKHLFLWSERLPAMSRRCLTHDLNCLVAV